MSNLTQKPYLIDGVIGNSRLLVTLNNYGELLSLFWPNIDYPQHNRKSLTGLTIKGKTHWFTAPDWQSKQHYEQDTNILITELTNQKLGIRVFARDFAVPKKDLLVRQYAIHSEEELNAKLTYFSSLTLEDSTLYNTAYFSKEDALIHYRRNLYVAIGSDHTISAYTCGPESKKEVDEDELQGTNISLSTDSAFNISFALKKGETKEISIYLAFGKNEEEALSVLTTARNNFDHLNETRQYWQEHLSKAVPLKANKKISDLYKRSLLTIKLMTDEEHGSIIAAPEFDPHFQKCGGYAYCWGRDAAYITLALDKSGYTAMATDFYAWTARTQHKDGSWLHRHYMDGSLAPSWGLQIDESGSILWGIQQHYLITKDISFLKEIWPTISSGAEFLISFLDENFLPKPSIDLWEEREGKHTYSAAAVFGGLTAAAAIAKELGYRTETEYWFSVSRKVKEGIVSKLWSQEIGRFLRGIDLSISKKEYTLRKELNDEVSIVQETKGYQKQIARYDRITDISLLGLSFPFGVLDPDDPKMIATARAIEELLTTPTIGGIKRYEDDQYIGGNPWILCTLWLSIYKAKQGETEKALELFHWASEHSTALGLLPEQIDRNTGEPAWVIPLTWSHAMYILAALELKDHLEKN